MGSRSTSEHQLVKSTHRHARAKGSTEVGTMSVWISVEEFPKVRARSVDPESYFESFIEFVGRAGAASCLTLSRKETPHAVPPLQRWALAGASVCNQRQSRRQFSFLSPSSCTRIQLSKGIITAYSLINWKSASATSPHNFPTRKPNAALAYMFLHVSKAAALIQDASQLMESVTNCSGTFPIHFSPPD
ncbi:hypothetical protein BDY21DRAFT_112651 [Lineolata rhizophorae]|uniref:Uncharacterized protein n=1 Tax=Lineolata rhizophorae TaxID=578093 RepID=A0A6A6NRQ1_9PEZI|nr:hypothetical protein BDY21DRAFT_112651 [Lineolata rhizophorae]